MRESCASTLIIASSRATLTDQSDDETSELSRRKDHRDDVESGVVRIKGSEGRKKPSDERNSLQPPLQAVEGQHPHPEGKRSGVAQTEGRPTADAEPTAGPLSLLWWLGLPLPISLLRDPPSARLTRQLSRSDLGVCREQLRGELSDAIITITSC